jgi:hypothetical protein
MADAHQTKIVGTRIAGDAAGAATRGSGVVIGQLEAYHENCDNRRCSAPIHQSSSGL